jgi:hypothetical protein
MPRNTGAQPGAMVTDKDKDNAPGRTIGIILGLALLVVVAYLVWANA